MAIDLLAHLFKHVQLPSMPTMLLVCFTQNAEDVTLQLQYEASFGNMKPNKVASYLEYKPQIYIYEPGDSKLG